MKYQVLYRGPLASCNYACAYCPFAKHPETRAALENDRGALERFCAWVAGQRHFRFGILFTPWGEALIRTWYQEALIFLSHLPQVERVAMQTNLSGCLNWVANCRKEVLALWTTFHPTQVRRARFVARVTQLYRDHIRLSVGVVGLREHFPDIARLCDELPPEVYLWINAYKRRVPYYSEEETLWLTAIDPFFPINNQQHECLGRPCAAGATSFAVDGQGIMRRCHFVEKPIGNIHSATWKASLRAAPCPKATCGCHIGYIFLPHLGQSLVYGENLLERIPIAIPARRATGL